MKTILELIESWEPCHMYKIYVELGTLHAGTTIDDILRSKEIDNCDKGWFFEFLLNEGFRFRDFDCLVEHKKVEIYNPIINKTISYSYANFLAMVDEYLEHADIDAAI